MFKKAIIPLFILFFLGCPKNGKNEECISLKEAEEIVLYEIVGADTMEWDTTKLRVYELPYMLEAGDTFTTEDTTLIINRNCWYFLILYYIFGRSYKNSYKNVFIYCDSSYEIIWTWCEPNFYSKLIEIKWEKGGNNENIR